MTTRTVELRQLAELNAGLRTRGGVRLDDARWLHRVQGSGPPSFPYVYGTVSDGRGGAPDPVMLHTPQLRAVSRRLKLRNHVWGW